MVAYLACLHLFPLQSAYRRRRAVNLLKIVANYDYSCFRDPRQRKARKALRVGVSPDCTLAYIDVLYIEGELCVAV